MLLSKTVEDPNQSQPNPGLRAYESPSSAAPPPQHFHSPVVFQPFLEIVARARYVVFYLLRRIVVAERPGTTFLKYPLVYAFPLICISMRSEMAVPPEKGIQLSRYIFVSEGKQQNQLVSNSFFCTLIFSKLFVSIKSHKRHSLNE